MNSCAGFMNQRPVLLSVGKEGKDLELDQISLNPRCLSPFFLLCCVKSRESGLAESWPRLPGRPLPEAVPSVPLSLCVFLSRTGSSPNWRGSGSRKRLRC